jgi:hypothetical protein
VSAVGYDLGLYAAAGEPRAAPHPPAGMPTYIPDAGTLLNHAVLLAEILDAGDAPRVIASVETRLRDEDEPLVYVDDEAGAVADFSTVSCARSRARSAPRAS